ncbi:hypothetical protein M434DRAFT_400765 [Hypoxylon sp. CO27-5]|nr:hypothetical protein M434DRAFT_400765 [Hypoxylon sp. CO27-5]
MLVASTRYYGIRLLVQAPQLARHSQFSSSTITTSRMQLMGSSPSLLLQGKGKSSCRS